MAIGVATQSGPVKPCFPPPIWFSSSCRRRPTTVASFLTGFSKSSKASHSVLTGWREPQNLVNSPRCSVVVFSSFLQFKRGLRYYTGPSTKKDDVDIFDEGKPQWILQVDMDKSKASGSSASMLAHYPSRINFRGEKLSGRLVNRTSVEEQKKQTPIHLHECLAREVELNKISSSSSCSALLPSTNECRSPWVMEAERAKANISETRQNIKNWKVKLEPEIPTDQSGLRDEKVELEESNDGVPHDKLELSRGPCSSGVNNINDKGDFHVSFNQGSFSYNMQAHAPLPRSSNSGEPRLINGIGKSTLRFHLIDEECDSHLAASNEPVHNNIVTENQDNPTLNHLRQVGLSLAQISSNGKMNGSFSSQLLDYSKGRTFTGARPSEGTERDLSSGESSSVADKSIKTSVEAKNLSKEDGIHSLEHRKKLECIYDKVIVVDNISVARDIVRKLTTQYKDLVYACDTEVAKIDVKQETPVDHGEVICFSIYSGPTVDFGNGKSCIWVDVLDGGGRDILKEFAPFFEDPSIRKVWHNYSFDSHVLENYGLKLSGFHADTMHMARLWDSSRRKEGGYSLEALTRDPKIVSNAQKCSEGELIGKISMKTMFGKKKVKKDGSEGKLITIPPVEELQRKERVHWICYSALDSISTLKLFESLQEKLKKEEWNFDGIRRETMYDFYVEYWRPFGEILVQMETEGMLVDRAYLAEMEKLATVEKEIAADRFRKWASRYCPDAIYMNVGSDTQLRQLFFGGIINSKDPNESLPVSKTFKVLNVDNVIEEGKKVATKYRNITLHNLCDEMHTEMYTATGWPSVSRDALKVLAGRVSAEYDLIDDVYESQPEGDDEFPPEQVFNEVEKKKVTSASEESVDISIYGTAYAAFGEGKEGREACHAVAALCEVCSIDSLISNFILPLQGYHISGKDGCVHCSLNINTETGRLSARRPNLQNQPALEKDRYKIRQAFIAAPGNSLVVADYGQLELRILAHLANCKSMLDAFKAGGDFHSRTAMNMYPHIQEAVEQNRVLLEWHPQPGEEKPPVPLLKDAYASERRKAKMLNFSIAYGKTPVGLSRDWKVSVKEAKKTVDLWYKERKEVLIWQEDRKKEAETMQRVHTLLGRARRFPDMAHASNFQRGHIERAAINTPVQGSAADVAMCAMLEISRNARLKELGWRLLLQVHDEVILEGPTESAEVAKAIVVECMSKPFYGTNILKVDLSVDAKCAQNWYAAK
ncbi:DNA polymerase I A, chloroplastic/mitochondrial-like [Macadamia integrifolia]|uniref:DNA polymerase I A, chloroplastic/mitochondrial-like n=1 Tax=Macadamia integrifolia TaxID=60698 RepID=UPI001C4FFB3B|nr:DNA polymerase I A, chloroplastic/mitochondrial-like [Macadamia integrifolia]